MKTWLPDYFTATLTGEKAASLLSVYYELDDHIDAWKKASPFDCPPGCGDCCTKFEPRASWAELDLLASYILLEKPGLTERLTSLREVFPCVFYTDAHPEHCTVYPARPLLCRLFAFAGRRGRDGNAEYALCKVMEPGNATRRYNRDQLLSNFGVLPPLMGDYAVKVTGINGGAESAIPLREGIAASISRVGMLMRLHHDSVFPPQNDDPSSSRNLIA